MGGKQDSIGVRLHEAVGLPEPEQEQTPGETRKPLFPQRCSHLKSFNLYLYPVAMLAARRCQSLSFEVALPLSAVGPYFRILHLCRMCSIAAASLRLLPPCCIVQNVAKGVTGLTIRNIKTMLPVGASPTVGEQGYRSVKDRELGIRFDPLASLSSAAQLAREGTF
jgi:hypothetical protein